MTFGGLREAVGLKRIADGAIGGMLGLGDAKSETCDHWMQGWSTWEGTTGSAWVACGETMGGAVGASSHDACGGSDVGGGCGAAIEATAEARELGGELGRSLGEGVTYGGGEDSGI
ncbi:hypothetical protein D8674_007062 [Pyrus ussuriensis x Pyrus communis]|uniref:Uncharacterized protein n=1 Tax=Pyrus ussuriensis x Pyrus communis TaxID=2448454 RepID=A0A5N5FW32_9ROSA|nr:hypothetical protein D8674_007062 [Pyrus ussuriensis x Pyrus communis]